jgi:hypothetical protein
MDAATVRKTVAIVAGLTAIASGAAYLIYFLSFERLGESLITAWNLLIVPAALYLGAVLAPRGLALVAGATAAGVLASLLWAFEYRSASLEPWWIGLAAIWWLGIGWPLSRERSRLGWFTFVLGVAAGVDFVLTAIDASMPLYALGGFKIPMTMIWSLALGISLLRRPIGGDTEHGGRGRRETGTAGQS